MEVSPDWITTKLRRLTDFDDELLEMVLSNGNAMPANYTPIPTSGMVNATDDGHAEHYQPKTALILPRITGVISIFAIICVAIEAWMDLRAHRTRGMTSGSRLRSVAHIQFFYQFPLFLQAVCFALGSTAAPQDEGIWGAAGSTATCTVQGLLFQFGIMAAISWDAALSLTFLRMVRYHVPDFRLMSSMKYYHLVIWSFALAMSVYPLVYGMYNFNHSFCWMQAKPDNCEGDECVRGRGATTMQNVSSLIMTIQLVYSISVLIALYCSMRGMENETRRYGSTRLENSFRDEASTGNSVGSRRNSRKVAVQGMWYASGMIITTLPITFYVLLGNLFGWWDEGYFIFANTVVPLIGYVNFLVFMRRRTNCHTRYALFLRRIHSWMFDYRCICQCHCNIQCLQFGKGKNDHTAPTTSPQGQRLGVDSWDTEQVKEGRPPTTECGDHSNSQVDGSDHSRRFMITVRRISSGSQLISDLSVPGSDFDRYDDSPKKPRRWRSSAKDPPPTSTGTGNRSPAQAAPPSKPVRLETCTSEIMSEVSTAELEVDKGSQPNGEGAPSKPIRLPTCILETVDEGSDSEHDDGTASKSRSKGSAPPSKPERLESCMPEESTFEVPQVQYQTDRPALRPTRIPSEAVEEAQDQQIRYQTDRPALRPMRLPSEAEA